MTNVCADCKFFKQIEGQEKGHCHRYAPSRPLFELDPTGNAIEIFAKWPLVRSTGWCGQFDRPYVEPKRGGEFR